MKGSERGYHKSLQGQPCLFCGRKYTHLAAVVFINVPIENHK